MSDVVKTGGMGFLGWLTLLFVALKLTGYITLSWWLVFTPMLVSMALGLLVLAIMLGVAIIAIAKG